jgi:hypothetical protein
MAHPDMVIDAAQVTLALGSGAGRVEICAASTYKSQKVKALRCLGHRAQANRR